MLIIIVNELQVNQRAGVHLEVAAAAGAELGAVELKRMAAQLKEGKMVLSQKLDTIIKKHTILLTLYRFVFLISVWDP